MDKNYQCYKDFHGNFDLTCLLQGASILRMLSNFMGDDLFKTGLTAYLNRYQYANAATKDLWTSLQQVCDQLHMGTLSHGWKRI